MAILMSMIGVPSIASSVDMQGGWAFERGDGDSVDADGVGASGERGLKAPVSGMLVSPVGWAWRTSRSAKWEPGEQDQLVVDADPVRASAQLCLGLATVGGLVLVLSGVIGGAEDGEPATWVGALLLGVGMLLVALAVKQWQGRPRRGEEAPVPAWMRKVDDFAPAKAGGAGFALSALNPKNILLTAAAALEIADVGLAAGQEIAVLAGFVIVASAGVLTPLGLTLAFGESSRELLENVRAGWPVTTRRSWRPCSS
jgi:threonine/homoserine/homoserine lactone efflux protein